jgi:hypothetical protein
MDYKHIKEQIAYLKGGDALATTVREINADTPHTELQEHAHEVVDDLMKNAVDEIRIEFDNQITLEKEQPDNFTLKWVMMEMMFYVYHELVTCDNGHVELLIEYINNETASRIRD